MTFESNKYNNRQVFKWLRAKIRGPRYLHFLFSANDKRIVYTYIRKNACSSFKELIVDLSTKQNKPTEGNKRARFCVDHYLLRNLRDLKEVDHTIFVYRDPAERIVSLYKNKFVHRKGADDIMNSYRRITNRDPLTASFFDFVYYYLNVSFNLLDPHVLPQKQHLLPIEYSDAIPMYSLYDNMYRILGPELANRYFRKPTNASITAPAVDNYNKPISYVSADKLHRHFKKTGETPETYLFLTENLKQHIEKLYSIDKCFSCKASTM